MNKKIKEIFGKAGIVYVRFPMVLVMSFIAAITVLVFINLKESSQYNYQNDFEIIKLIIVSQLGISLFFGLKILSQKIGKELILQVLGILFLISFYFILPENENDFTIIYAFIIIPTFILTHLFVSFSAFLGKKDDAHFWEYNKDLFINFGLTIFFTGVLTGGCLLAILAVDKLFDFNIKGYVYSQVFFFLAIFGSTFIFLIFCGNGLPDLKKAEKYPQILKFFTQFVLIPLLLIYLIILYFYSGKIILNWELPRGWVSYLILAYSIIGMLALLLVHPLKEISAKSWVKIFSKIFYLTLIPLLLLLFVAINTRILEYGYTEARYFVMLIAVWLSVVVFYFVFIKNSTIKFIPVSLFIFLVFALVFPYLNAFSVAKKSQENELSQILEKNKLLTSGKIDFSKKINSAVLEDISDKFKFLFERKDLPYLLEVMPVSTHKKINLAFADKNSYSFIDILNDGFKNVAHSTKYARETHYLSIYTENRIQDISNYDYAVNSYSFENSFIIEGTEWTLSNGQFNNKKGILIKANGKTYNITPLIDNLFKNINKKEGSVLKNEIYITSNINGHSVKINFESIRKNQSYEKPYFIENATILIKKK